MSFAEDFTRGRKTRLAGLQSPAEARHGACIPLGNLFLDVTRIQKGKDHVVVCLQISFLFQSAVRPDFVGDEIVVYSCFESPWGQLHECDTPR